MLHELVIYKKQRPIVVCDASSRPSLGDMLGVRSHRTRFNKALPRGSVTLSTPTPTGSANIFSSP